MKAIYHSPCGNLILEEKDNKLSLCDWAIHYPDIAFSLPSSDTSKSELILEATSQLNEYFSASRTEFSIPLSLQGSKFQSDIFKHLLLIPYGTTLSYQELAIQYKSPGYSRAVAQALASNKISIFLPCHRIIAANNNIGGYRGGINAKKFLLNLEKGIFSYNILSLTD